ncbi:kinase-like domain-containing protein [Podospora fimiseda]|uniref:Kinase-like domain-containing protein n=1 Tax=Podospora fimiseda TaxID=252190 RepID=A0AAN7GXR4_9PEZI|nr:kinase-like domain-containing protein [Podospora fimiseda]
MNLEKLRDDILGLRVPNFEHKPDKEKMFVPEGALESILLSSTIEEVLQSCDFQGWSICDITKIVDAGGRKTLSILVLLGHVNLITAFIEHDGRLKGRLLDSGIPFAEETLQKIIPECAAEFYVKQWEFAAPVFSQRLLGSKFDTNTILPFTKRLACGEGGFGEVWSVSIPKGHHVFDGVKANQNAEFALKILQAVSESASLNPEHDVLAYLHHVKHPCITPLLTFYTYQGDSHFLFPLFKGGDLKHFLSSQSWPGAFVTGGEDAVGLKVYLALAGLASALEALHNFDCASLGVKMIGYHSDIKPQNILVDKDKFVLADFGLAKLKDGLESKAVHGDLGWFSAPECQSWATNSANGKTEARTGRLDQASDVWSLGCVAFETLIYLTKGAAGVEEFSMARKYKHDGIWEKTFYKEGDINPPVSTALQVLVESNEPGIRESGLAIQKVLLMDPKKRLTALQLTARFKFISLSSAYHITRQRLLQLSEFQDLGGKWDLRVQWARFEQWANVLGIDMMDLSGETLAVFETLNPDVAAVFEKKSPVQSMLDTLLSLSSRKDPLPLGHRMRNAIDALCADLPPGEQHSIKNRLEIQVLAACSDLDLKGFANSNSLAQSLNSFDLGILAAIRRMHLKTQEFKPTNETESLDSNIRIESTRLKDKEDFQSCITAKYFQPKNKGGQKVPVLVEWIKYGDHWGSEKEGNTLFNRIGVLVYFLNDLHGKLPSTGSWILPCLGFFHDIQQRRFGLVYQLELNSQSGIMRLYDLIKRTTDQRQRPSLDDIYLVCWQLSVALLQFHKFNWLHKNISSFQIIIDGSAAPANSLRVFKIIGFNSSRPSDPNEYTEGPWARKDEQEEQRKFQHPEYFNSSATTATCRYRARYDYYSFGLVLAELGTWSVVKNLKIGSGVEKEKEENEKTRQVNRRVCKILPSLAHRMGTRFRDVVKVCLTEEAWPKPNNDGSSDLGADDVTAALTFESRVVRELDRLANRA